MQSLNGGYSPALFYGSNTHNPAISDWTTDQAIIEASRRLSRGYGSQRGITSTRITKPSSTSNSPGTTATISARRRTIINDDQSYRRAPQPQGRPAFSQNSTNRPARPVSWHPSSHMFTLQPYMNQQPSLQVSTPGIYAEQQELSGYPSLSPMMASYSTNTSPCSAFSPLPMAPYQFCPPQYLSQTTWDVPQHQVSQYQLVEGRPCYPDGLPSLTHAPSLDTPAANTLDWNSYTPHGLSNTTPPTPDSFVGLSQPQPSVSGDTVPYEALDDSEEEGEILVGMGLYDAPEKFEEDPQLNNYRSTVSSLLGATYQRMEPTGKGLKLEETWVPPQSEDSDEEEEEDSDESED